MRVKNFLKFLGIFVTIFVLQIATVDKVAASDINFGQKIFPVKFVYVTDTGNIESIWSNVSSKDDMYVVKFFDAEKKNEITSDQKMLSLFSQNDNENQISIAFTKKTQLIQKDSLFLEEITTIV